MIVCVCIVRGRWITAAQGCFIVTLHYSEICWPCCRDWLHDYADMSMSASSAQGYPSLISDHGAAGMTSVMQRNLHISRDR